MIDKNESLKVLNQCIMLLYGDLKPKMVNFYRKNKPYMNKKSRYYFEESLKKIKDISDLLNKVEVDI